MFGIPHRIKELQSFSGAERPRCVNDFRESRQGH
jgi:hypothetical protein